jgi:murein tripeptide amidase MpaA
MITGETHARELLSAQVPLFLCLKLIHQGVLHGKDRYQSILRNTKFYFLPVVNVDGAAVIERHWLTDGKIINKRKNMNPNY